MHMTESVNEIHSMLLLKDPFGAVKLTKPSENIPSAHAQTNGGIIWRRTRLE